MKNILLLFYFCNLTLILPQKIDFISIINDYRTYHGSSKIILNDDLSKIAKEQNYINIKSDSISHSHKSSEIANMGTSLPKTQLRKDDFINFINKYFNLTYKEPSTNKDVEDLVMLYSIYLFNNSPSHKRILLGDYTYMGYDINISNINLKSNKMLVGPKEVILKNFISHYEVTFFTTINFK